MHKIYDEFMNMPDGKLKIEWVSSHTGMPGNEKADHLAGEALNLLDPQKNSCTTDYAMRELRDKIWGGSGTEITAMDILNCTNLEQR